jgi:cell division protein FtsL
LRGWFLLTLTVTVAFFLLIYSRIALDRSAFVLEEVERMIEVEEARYWELRLQAAELRSPGRITELAGEMGLVYPEEVRTIEVPGVPLGAAGVEDRWVDLKALLSARP